MAGTAGRKALVKVSGDATAFTNEATTTADDTVYQITSATKRVWDRFVTIVVKDGGVEVDAEADPYTINRLTGKVTFESSDAGRVITVSGDYLPLSAAAEAKDYNYGMTATLLDDSAFGDSWRTRVQGLKAIAGKLGRWLSADTVFSDALTDDTPVVIEMYSNGAITRDFIFWATINSDEMQAPLQGLLEESVSFEGTVDADLRTIST